MRLQCAVTLILGCLLGSSGVCGTAPPMQEDQSTLHPLLYPSDASFLYEFGTQAGPNVIMSFNCSGKVGDEILVDNYPWARCVKNEKDKPGACFNYIYGVKGTHPEKFRCDTENSVSIKVGEKWVGGQVENPKAGRWVKAGDPKAKMSGTCEEIPAEGFNCKEIMEPEMCLWFGNRRRRSEPFKGDDEVTNNTWSDVSETAANGMEVFKVNCGMGADMFAMGKVCCIDPPENTTNLYDEASGTTARTIITDVFSVPMLSFMALASVAGAAGVAVAVRRRRAVAEVAILLQSIPNNPDVE